MDIELIDEIAPDAWDEEIAPYESTMLFHQSAWLDFLVDTSGGTPLRFRIRKGNRTEGFFVALLQRKGLLNILGSPLSGWRTDYMGPIVNVGFDQEAFLVALDALARKWKIDFSQIGSPLIDSEVMSRMGYSQGDWPVFVLDLDPDPEIMWSKVSGKCRNRIRKGRSYDLVVENDRDPGFVDEYYSQLVEVYARQGLPPPDSAALIANLYRHLMPDNLFALRVRQGQTTVATGVFIHDHETVASFGIASRTGYLHLCPNELLNWTVMTIASELGLRRFILGHDYRLPRGIRQFKKKFNCRRESVYRYSKIYSTRARVGHGLHKALYAVRWELGRTRKWPLLGST